MNVPRFQVVEGDELAETQAMLLCELGGEEPPPGFLVIDSQAPVEGEGDIVAYIPAEVGGITAADFAQRVAVLAAVGEPSASQESIDDKIERAAIAICELGKVEWDVQEDHRKEHFRQMARAAAGVLGFLHDDQIPLTPSEARIVVGDLSELGDDSFKGMKAMMAIDARLRRALGKPVPDQEGGS